MPADAEAMVLNATAVRPTATETYLSLYPTNGLRPTVSNINPRRGQVVPNLVTATTGPAGGVAAYNHSGSTDLVVDIAGYYIRR